MDEMVAIVLIGTWLVFEGNPSRDLSSGISSGTPSGLVPIEGDDLPAGSVFLPKPYRESEIVAALRELTGTA